MIFTALYGAMWYYYLLDFVFLIILIPAIIFTLIAQSCVRSTYKKYAKVYASTGLTGAEVARKILANAGVFDVLVSPIKGSLTDNYNPKTKVLSLSEDVFSGMSVAALGIAAHEAGHAIQHSEGYFPLTLRSIIVPVTNIGSRIAFPLAILGVVLEWFAEQPGGIGGILIAIGILCYSFATLFSLITLPVEINASRRARRALIAVGALDKGEVKQAGKVLNAAALTYFAALAVSLVYLLRFLLIISSMRRRRD